MKEPSSIDVLSENTLSNLLKVFFYDLQTHIKTFALLEDFMFMINDINTTNPFFSSGYLIF